MLTPVKTKVLLHFKINFKISARVDTINPEVVAALKKAGCYRIHFGIESATPKYLQYLQKSQTLEKVERACKMTREVGMGFFAYMMIGIPHETKEEMFATVDFAKKLKPDYAQFSICTPYPKVELYYQMLNEGIVPEDYWQKFAENPTPEFKIRFWNKDFTEEELVFCALHHDLGKVGSLDENWYLPNDSQWHIENQGKIYKANPDMNFMNMTGRTFWLLNQFGVKVEEGEWIATWTQFGRPSGLFIDKNDYSKI